MTITVADLFRHPIKSHGVERIEKATLTAGLCLPWDRVWAVAHEASQYDEEGAEWAPCANFSRGAKAPRLMAVKVTVNETSGTLSLSHPDLADITIDPNTPKGAASLIDWSRPLMPTDRAASARLVAAKNRGMTDTPFPSVSFNSYASLRALSEQASAEVSALRFRGYIWLEGLEPWQEFDWIGKEIQVGDVRFAVRERIGRCTATLANPDTGLRDIETLKVLEQNWGHTDFGVYAEVLTNGTLQTGDTVSVIS